MTIHLLLSNSHYHPERHYDMQNNNSIIIHLYHTGTILRAGCIIPIIIIKSTTTIVTTTKNPWLFPFQQITIHPQHPQHPETGTTSGYYHRHQLHHGGWPNCPRDLTSSFPNKDPPRRLRLMIRQKHPLTTKRQTTAPQQTTTNNPIPRFNPNRTTINNKNNNNTTTRIPNAHPTTTTITTTWPAFRACSPCWP